MLSIYNNSVTLPIDTALIFEEDRLAIRSEIKEWLVAHVTNAWSHDLFDGWSRFTFENADDAASFATLHDTAANAPETVAPSDDIEADDTPITNPDVDPQGGE